MPPACLQSASRMPPECYGMPPECLQNASRMPSECLQNASRMPPECPQNAARSKLKPAQYSFIICTVTPRYNVTL